MSSEIQTFLYLNIGVTGVWDRDYELSPIKLCIKPVSRQELTSGVVDLDSNIALFPFDDISGEYEEGKSIIEYDLTFNEAVSAELMQYLEGFPKPVVMVSYAGYKQNFPIIRAGLGHLGTSLPADLRCADFMQAIYEIENQVGPPAKPRDQGLAKWEFQPIPVDHSYAFGNMYERVTRHLYTLNQLRPIRQSPGEQGIVVPHIKMMVQCCQAVLPQWLQWVDLETSTTSMNSGLLPHNLRI